MDFLVWNVFLLDVLLHIMPGFVRGIVVDVNYMIVVVILHEN